MKYTRHENIALLFGARYAFNRPTGSALAVVKCLIANWDKLDERTKIDVVRESQEEATCNTEDWQMLWDHAEKSNKTNK